MKVVVDKTIATIQGKIGDIGQGGEARLLSWISVIYTMLEAYRKNVLRCTSN